MKDKFARQDIEHLNKRIDWDRECISSVRTNIDSVENTANRRWNLLLAHLKLEEVNETVERGNQGSVGNFLRSFK